MPFFNGLLAVNLKNFHIVFIVVSTLFCVGFGFWCTSGTYPAADGFQAFGYLAWVCAVALIAYGAVYFRKLHQLNRSAI